MKEMETFKNNNNNNSNKRRHIIYIHMLTKPRNLPFYIIQISLKYLKQDIGHTNKAVSHSTKNKAIVGQITL